MRFIRFTTELPQCEGANGRWEVIALQNSPNPTPYLSPDYPKSIEWKKQFPTKSQIFFTFQDDCGATCYEAISGEFSTHLEALDAITKGFHLLDSSKFRDAITIFEKNGLIE